MADVLILAIETATGCGGVALTRGAGATGKVLAEYTLQPEVTHSRRLLGSVAAVLNAAGVAWNQLDGVAVSQGPGSFTGLRIGMAAAKGLAMAANLPLLAVPTLDGLAAQVPPIELPMYCLLDARKQQVYGAEYRQVEGGWRRRSPYFAMMPEQLAQRIDTPTLLIGPGLLVCRSKTAANPLIRITDGVGLHPRAATIGLCGGRMLMDGTGDDAGEIVPLYVRASEAELHLQAMVRVEQGAI